jgi:hypothetical protein
MSLDAQDRFSLGYHVDVTGPWVFWSRVDDTTARVPGTPRDNSKRFSCSNLT